MCFLEFADDAEAAAEELGPEFVVGGRGFPLETGDALDPSRTSATAALFAFVSTTDPEVWLLIESRDADDGPQWHWAAARMTFLSVQMLHEGRLAWDVPQAAPPWSNVRDPDKAYIHLQWQSLEEADGDAAPLGARPAGRS